MAGGLVFGLAAEPRAAARVRDIRMGLMDPGFVKSLNNGGYGKKTA